MLIIFCTTDCLNCEDKKCKYYISKYKLYFENTQLKSVLNEIREYIENNKYYSWGMFNQFEEIILLENDIDNLLVIIDKGIKKED